ncbi:MAG: hypothetical protein ACXAEU_17200 [Candidatus Hodarchaeales archaeon]|jgi:hypothetical protein
MSTRDERLAALQDAVETWADKETERLEEEVSFLQSVFDGRTNGGQLSNFIVEEASVLLEKEINAYLTE